MSASDEFAQALLNPENPVPPMIVAVGNRFDIYRNNVFTSLTEALSKTFPVVEAMVGEEYFAAMARAFVRQAPPRSPILADFGAGFSDFIGSLTPLVDYPYLADLARLEWARLEVMRAADGSSDETAAARTTEPEAVVETALALSPSARLLVSDHPFASLWRLHQDPEALEGLEWAGEQLIVFRSENGLIHAPLSLSEYQFLQALSDYPTIGDGLMAQSDPDAAAVLLRSALYLLRAGALVSRPSPALMS
ncbi:MAG: putative DNA-binding domain-containing protein [Sphingomonas sp.]|nr:putative DNA-binding domain-containing protein [Sphingomonas sp.]